MPEAPNKRKPRAGRTAPAAAPTPAGGDRRVARRARAGLHDPAIELAIVSGVQDALASRLGMQAIYDLVGDRIREVFRAQVVGIGVIDPATGLLHIPYLVERGRRVDVPGARAPAERGFAAHVRRTGRSLTVNTGMAERMAELGEVTQQGETPKSAIWVPLRVAGHSRGAITVQDLDREGAFSEADVRLLETLAASMSVALENARLFDETQRLFEQSEQRARELALINSIQQGMAAKLEFQGIVDLVGDKLREVFGSEDLSIRWWDPEADTIDVVYVVEHGEHLPKGPPRPVGAANASTRRLLHEGVGAYFGSHDEQVAAGIAGPQPGTDWCLSIIGAPIRGTQRVLGMIVIENHQREHAYGEADLRVLTTIGATMGTALENARLFDETQRLLKETEQRNAELAVIASVQQGIAAELDLQAIIDLVGDKLREVFATGDIGIWWWDAERRQGHSSYVFEHGVRHHHEPYTVKPGKVWERLFDGRETLLVHNRAESIAIGMHALEGTDQSLSALCMPIIGGDRVLGSVVLEDYERENAFGPDAVRLLGTVVASMGTALENARLFDETQRLLKETERRERESTALSEVGRDLSSTLDLATVMDRIAGHAKELLAAQNSAIFLPDAATGNYRAIVAKGDLAEALKATFIEPGQGIIGSLLQSGQAEFINSSAADPRALQIPGTETRADERLMVVPLLAGEATVLGAMAVWRSGGHPFEARDLAFLEGLSRQATIALQNARLFDETRAALDRQTASADVLQVISGSMADAQPVFEKVLDSCRRLFGTDEMGICLARDGMIDFPAYRGGFTHMIKEQYPRPLAGSVSEGVILTG
jgi:GAF domain-containing protein